MDNFMSKKQFGQNVKNARIYYGITLPDLAKKARISQGNLSKIENGLGNPTLTTINSLAKVLFCEGKNLMEWNGWR